MLRFLHAADLHLGSAAAAFSPRMAAVRRERQLAALEQLFTDARARGAQLFLLAGDIFDTPEPDADLAARFFSILAAQTLPVVIAPGNHDPYREGGFWARAHLPAHVHLFDSPQLSSFDFPELGLSVWGYAFTAENAPAPELGDGTALPADRVSVLLAHGDLAAPLSPYAPISPAQLAASGFAYAALGHIHNPAPPHLYGNTLAAYSGFFAGRGFDELGEGHALLVSVEEGVAKAELLTTAADRFECLTADMTGATSGEEVRARTAAFLQEADLPDTVALRLLLSGNVGLACRPDAAALAALGQRFALFEVIDQTMPILDADYLSKDPTLRGAFYRALLPRLSAADAATRATAAEALRLGLAALAGKEV